ncbi:hypothetical protein LguiB_011832 [Lonicera macranthoides]
MALIETQIREKPYNVTHFIGENYELALNQSIQTLVDSLQKRSSNFSISPSTFLDLMQARVNPPLETIWVYSALTFRTIDSPKDELLDLFLVAKNLFHSIAACSSSCSSSKSIVLIAPVIYEIYRVFVDLKGKDSGSKKDKKVLREIKSLVDVILGYINVCSLGNDGDELEGLIRPLGDLVRVWIGDSLVENEDDKGYLRLFFPLLSNETVELLSGGACDVSELAGVVIAEALLLKLCLKFSDPTSRVELQNELKTWAVGSITGFGNFQFFEALVKMLLEPTLPVTSLLSPEDEIFLRKVLYDAVILVEYCFLNLERAAQLPTKHVKSLTIARLMVAHQAIELFRGNGDQTKAISYMNAFSASHLPCQIIKLVTSEIGKASGPNGSSPKAFLDWLLNLEDQGMRLLGDGVSNYRAKLTLDSIKADEQKALDSDLLFYIDNKGREEDENDEEENMNKSIDAAFVAAAGTMQSAENEGRKKRKKRGDSEKKNKVKFVKYNVDDLSGTPAEKSAIFDQDGSNSESEVENPVSDDEDVEVKEL